ncbi:MAG: hypothetical protein JO251_00600, partial [Verrucomicrobia bacterium]|nr:hypothetical protein [Verrucomicrobiota bacterium]
KMSQVQLLLPFLAIFASHLVLGEEVDGPVIFGVLAISAIVVAGRWSLTLRQREAKRSEPRTANAEPQTVNVEPRFRS